MEKCSEVPEQWAVPQNWIRRSLWDILKNYIKDWIIILLSAHYSLYGRGRNELRWWNRVTRRHQSCLFRLNQMAVIWSPPSTLTIYGLVLLYLTSFNLTDVKSTSILKCFDSWPIDDEIYFDDGPVYAVKMGLAISFCLTFMGTRFLWRCTKGSSSQECNLFYLIKHFSLELKYI